MEGVSAVTARIGEIRAMLHPVATPAAAVTAPLPTPLHGVGAERPSSAGLSFADVLATATAPADGQPALSVAALHAKYQNGRVPADALAPIGAGTHRLAAPAAAAFDQMQAAARREGVTFGVTDSYRSFDAQVDVARRKGLYSQGGLAAQPGTSQHGWGLAVDLDLDARAQAWMRANGARFGFVEDTPREPWHWAYEP